LAAHLAVQVRFVPRTLTDPPPPGEVVTLDGHYTRAAWVGADLDDETNVQIRRGGEQSAAEGPGAVAAGTAGAVEELRTLLAQAPADRLVHPPAGPWALLLDDFLVTRMMEIAVHSDDLAYSVGIPTPDLPPEVLGPVLGLLSRLAVRRHGQAAVLRGLTRAERAPASIVAFLPGTRGAGPAQLTDGTGWPLTQRKPTCTSVTGVWKTRPTEGPG